MNEFENQAAPAPRPAEPSVPVVKVLSVRGVEYGLMTFMVWFGAASIIWCLLALVNGSAGFDNLAFPVSLLLTALPVFGFLFIRLRKAELANPALRTEPSKRRFSQLTQFLAFFASFVSVLTYVYILISAASGSEGTSLVKSGLSSLVVLVVAGGVFTYYWFDEHRTVKR